MASTSLQSDQVVPPFSFPVFCYCRRNDGRCFEAVERTSWKPSNPGRRFFNCRNSYNFQAGVQKCDFFTWKYENVKMYWKQLILSLKEEIQFLRTTLSSFVPLSVIEGLEDENCALNVEKDLLIREKKELLKKIEELEGEMVVQAAEAEENQSKLLKQIEEIQASLAGKASESEKKVLDMRRKVVIWQVVCVSFIIAIVAMLASKLFRS